MAGYTRQSTYLDGDTILAADSNDEFAQLLEAFVNTTGHSHDGTAAEGPVIGIIGDAGVTTPLNKVVVDSVNDRVGFFIDVSSSAVEQIRLSDGVLAPITDNDIDLGTGSLGFKDGYLAGALTVAGLATLGDITLSAANPEILGGDTDGVLYIAPSTTNALGGNIILYGDTHATKAKDLEFRATAGVELHYDDSASKWDFQANAIDTSGVVTFSGGGALTGTWTDLGTVTTVDINGGTADTFVIGGSTAAAGTFTTLTANTSFVLNGSTALTSIDVDISSVSASDDTLASAKAIKTYVDAQITASDLDFQGDSGGALSIDLDSETLTIAGGTGIDTSGAINTLTVAIDSTVATLTGSQTLTNKTINTASNTITVLEADISDLQSYLVNISEDTTPTFGGHVAGGGFDITSLGTLSMTEQADANADVAGNGQLWVKTATPNQLWFTDDAGTDFQLASLAGTETLSNKTLASPAITGNTTTTGTIDGRDVATDGSKLDGIEALADVTDTANVTAAGALMDSEVDADIKTLVLPASTTISAFGATVIDDADAAAARTTLDVDQSGTDNSTDVTLAGTGTYISIAGQVITVDPITESDISDLGAYLEAGDSPVWTGAHDFGGATSLEIPNSETPTVNADGEIAIDTTITDFSMGLIKYFSGEEMAVVALPIAELTTPTGGTVVSYNATTDEFELATAGAGDMAAVTYDPATIAEQLVGLTATQTLTNKQMTTIELGHATDTTLTRASAGVLAVEGKNVMLETIIAAKGDLIAATANDTPAILSVGTNDYVLTADSAEATGMKWAERPGAGVGGDTILYTSSDTWTKPSGLTKIRVWTVGGGGGGGGASSGTADSGQAGSFGAVAYEEIAAASLGATETVTIGAAGTGGSSGSNNGTSGGNSSFGSHHTANGGTGGYHATHGSRTSAVSAATATGGDVNVSSIRIGNDSAAQETSTVAGAVSVSPFYLGPLSTSGGGSVIAGDDGESTDANAFGSSGSGGDGNSSTNVGGGDGAVGCILVEEIF